MPRNKIQQDPAEKRTEIVGAARKLFLETGYEATSMASIAAAAGVASNTIYWYFQDKDELLVAVLDAELERGMAKILGAPDTDTTGRLLLVVRQLERARRLVATVHARIQISPVIAAWHDRFHELSETLVQSEMHQAGIATKTAKALVKIWVFTIEGLLAHPMSDAEKRQICSYLATKLTAA
jgi:AcrR family transcriptional regulator